MRGMYNRKRNATTVMTALLAVSIVANPMAVPVHAQETDTIVIEQQTAQEEPIRTQNEESDSQETAEIPATAETAEDPAVVETAAGPAAAETEVPDTTETAEVPDTTETEKDIPATDTEEQTDISETQKEEAPADQLETQPNEAPNMMFRSTPAPNTAGDVEINEDNFPDEAFRTWLTGQKYGKDNVLTAEEIAGITTINITGTNKANIKNLKGIEHFTELTVLICSNTGITSLDLSQNKALKALTCNNIAALTSLDVSQNKALESLDCSWTGLASLDLRQNKALKSLDYHRTNLTNLDVSQNTALELLNCSSIKGITSLDVSRNTALTKLYCQGTSIITLDVSHNLALDTLDCSNTGITSLDVSKNTALKSLTCHNNKGMTTLDVSKNTALTYLQCSLIGITELNVSQNTALTFLGCYGTGITNLDLSQNTNLQTLYCYNTKITSLDLSQNTALNALYCYKTNITSLDLSQNTALVKLECYGTGITSLDLSKHTALSTLLCNDCPLAWLKIGNNTNLTKITMPTPTIALKMTEDTFKITDMFKDIDPAKVDITNGADYDKNTGTVSNYHEATPIKYTYDCGTSANGPALLQVTVNLTDYTAPIKINEDNFPDQAFRTWLTGQKYGKDGKLTAEEIAGITTMVIAGNENIKDLTGISYFTALTLLDCSGTGITDLDISSNKALKTLDCMSTGIESLDVSQNEELTYLNCSYTKISSLDLRQNTALESLYCSNAKLTSLDLGQNTALKDLDCRDNTGITSLDVTQNTALTTLYCSSTGINKLDVTQNTALKDLRCGDTNIEALDVSQNTALTFLECYMTGIVKLDVSRNTALTNLSCGITGIESLDVSKNTALTSLDCGNTKITKLDVSQNTALTSLDCGSTMIKSLDVSKNTALTYLYCAYTGITSLDVSQNTVLETLECQNCPLVWLNIGDNTNLSTLNKAESIISLEMREDTFYITDKFPDIDKSKVTVISGADYDSSTGSVSNYKKDVPIEFIYDCGTSSDGTQQTLSVKLKLEGLKDKSTISIIEDLNKTYDKTAVSDNPKFTKTGSTGAVTYRWEKKKSDSDWELISSAPADAGTYRVTATLAADNDYKEASSEPVEFTIAKAIAPQVVVPDHLSAVQDDKLSSVDLPNGWTWADKDTKVTAANSGYKARLTVDDRNYDYTGIDGYDQSGHYVERTLIVIVISREQQNAWVTEPSISDWTYGETASTPQGSAKYGKVTFSYSSSETGTFIAEVPTTAGTWYMKASVPASSEYTGLNKIMSFTIKKAVPVYQTPQDLTAVYGQTLQDIVLPQGFTWTDKTTSVGNAGSHSFTVTFTPDDTANYETVENISVTLAVTKADNASTGKPTLEGWTYGETPNKANAGFKFGTPRFLYSQKPDGTYTQAVPTTVGTWYVKAVVDGTDNYSGAESEAVAFTIGPKNAEAGSQITVPDITAGTNLEHLTIMDGDKALVPGTDYDITKTQDKNKVTVTITFKGNYSGTITKTYTKNEDNPTDGKTDTGNEDKPTGGKTDTGNKGNTGNAVQTGDTANTGLWTMLLALSAGVTAFLIGKKRKTAAEDGEE